MIWGRWAAVTAFALIASFPPIDAGWLSWGAFVPWLLALEKHGKRGAFLWSYLVGLFFFGGTIWWVGYVTVPGVVLLVLYCALYFGLWGWLSQKLLSRIRRSPSLLLGLPSLWVLLEYVRSFLLTGFGWNFLGHTQWKWPAVIQIADLAGVYGVSFLVMLMNVAFYLLVRGKGKKPELQGPLWIIAAVACFLGAVLSYGSVRLREFETAPAAGFKAAVLQGNIPQSQKWDEAFQEAIWKRYEQLTAQAAQMKPDLIIWPETAVPDYADDPRVAARLQGLARTAGAPMLVGAPVGEEVGETIKVFNSGLLIDRDGRFLDRYDKIHLVPFGEYVPLGPLLAWLRNLVLMGDFSHGRRATVFYSPSPSGNRSAGFSMMICFEDLFPGLCRRFAKAGAKWLVVVTNDAWFGRSAASVQHLQASVFRAVEQRMWVVRAANTGWSGFVTPAGAPLPKPHHIPLFHPGVAQASIDFSKGLTFYCRAGDWLMALALLLVGWAFFDSRKRVS
ncbi:MAG: apolipoprotein N-acyltransferase [Candidatus Omnitrophica bacterium]|nr:apolipoprotein N-acyltransferase [Candidatus Omnitrophota bacterium]